MRSEAKVGLFVFLVLVLSVVFLVAHEFSRRAAGDADEVAVGEGVEEAGLPPMEEPDERFGPPGGDRERTREVSPSPWDLGEVRGTTGAGREPAARRGTSSGPIRDGRAEPPVRESEMPVPPTADSAPEPRPARTYTVKSGDVLTAISREVYGSVRHYMRIYEANRDKLRSPDDLSVGMDLLIPDLEGAAPAQREAGVAEGSTASAPLSTGGREHVVAVGDVLTSIAREYYGIASSRAINRIYEANRDRIPNPDVLRIGTRLVIPAAE